MQQCDLERPSCTSCIRANATCAGYRDTEALRLNDESQATRTRATTNKAKATSRTVEYSTRPATLPLDLLVQAREFFFGYYIGDFCRVWDFLYPYSSSSTGPEHLTLSIDAVSLAFLSHQLSSQTAQHLGRQKYIFALRKTNAALRSPGSAHETTTLQTSLLLDLFEKMTSAVNEGQERRRAHVDGALALVKFKGLHHFNDSAGLKVLSRLLLNATISYVSQSDPTSKDVYDIRDYLAQFIDISDPKWKLSGLVLQVADLVSAKVGGRLTREERVQQSTALNKELEILSLEAPSVWSFERKHVSEKAIGVRALGDFYDVHNNRITTQRWNALHTSRLMLCEDIIRSLPTKIDVDSCPQSQSASAAAALSIEQICASVAQITDCNGPAQKKLTGHPVSHTPASHSHTLSHLLDAYILIFPLYVAWWSCACPFMTRKWIVEQLLHIAEHFGIREAKKVVEIMRSTGETARIGPWEVYRLCGSYAFAA